MKLAPLELRTPQTLDEALRQLAALGSDAQVLAGGQSLVPLLRYRVLRAHVLLDINRIETLSSLSFGARGIRIGALVRHAALEKISCGNPSLLAALMAAHAREIAFWPVRNRGTAVGSLMQADPKGDWPLLFCALDAQIELASTRGVRSVPVREFILGPLLTARAVDELATALVISPAQAQFDAWGRAKLMHRAGEYAMCSAIALRRGADWECWIGAVGDKPFALSRLARALSADASQPRSALLMLASSDIEAALPELDPLERRRHAVNAVDAAERAVAQGEKE